nr:6949_t:CDS:1 [Entrophospora candida]
MLVKIKNYIPLKLIKIVVFTTIFDFSTAQILEYDPRTVDTFYKRIDSTLGIIMTNFIPILLFYTLSPPDVDSMSNKIGLIDDILYIILPMSYEAYQGISTYFCEDMVTFSLYSLVILFMYSLFTLLLYMPKLKDLSWVKRFREDIMVDWAIPLYYVIFFIDNTLYIFGLFHSKRPNTTQDESKFMFLYTFILLFTPMLWYRLQIKLYFFNKSIGFFYIFLLGLFMFLIRAAIVESSHDLGTNLITSIVIALFIRMTFLTYSNKNKDAEGSTNVYGLHRHWIEKKNRTHKCLNPTLSSSYLPENESDYIEKGGEETNKELNDNTTTEKKENHKLRIFDWCCLGLMIAYIVLILIHTLYDFGLNGYYFDVQYWITPRCTSIRDKK